MVCGSTLIAQSVDTRITTLKTQYEGAVERAVRPLRNQYLSELNRLKANYVKSGDLEAALAVDKEINSMPDVLHVAKAKIPDNEKELHNFLIDSIWVKFTDGQTKWRFDREGNFISESESSRTGKWNVAGRRIVEITWWSGDKTKVLFSEDCRAFAEQGGRANAWIAASR